MKQYRIIFSESKRILEIDLFSMYLTAEMVEQIIQDNEPSLSNLDWELYKKDKHTLKNV